MSFFYLDIRLIMWYNKNMRNKGKKIRLGRAPDMGRVSFKTGVILSRKNREGNRNTKHARNELRRQLGDK